LITRTTQIVFFEAKQPPAARNKTPSKRIPHTVRISVLIRGISVVVDIPVGPRWRSSLVILELIKSAIQKAITTCWAISVLLVQSSTRLAVSFGVGWRYPNRLTDERQLYQYCTTSKWSQKRTEGAVQIQARVDRRSGTQILQTRGN